MLEQIGRWLGQGRAEAFEGVRPGPLAGSWGDSVSNGEMLWLHVRRPARVSLNGLEVGRWTLLPGGAALALETDGSLDLREVDLDPVVTLVRLEFRAQTRSSSR